MLALELRHVDLNLGRNAVLRDISLEVSAGERLVIVGPSGAGKSSLLRVFAGLVQPTRGNVLLDGKPLSNSASAGREIALLGQDYALYPQLNVEQNLEVALRRQQLSKAECAERIEQIVRSFEIADIRKRIPSQISGGQAQRVALAKALVRHSRLLLLDEPLSQLDPRLREQLIQLVLAASEEAGLTICWVAHDPCEAFRVANRIAVMDSGRLIQVDTPEAIYRTPQSRLTADLLSHWPINWIPLESPEFEKLNALKPRPGVVVGIRPEDWESDVEWKAEPQRMLKASACPGPAQQTGCIEESKPHHSSDRYIPNAMAVIQESCFLGHSCLAWAKLGTHRILLHDRFGLLKPGTIARLSVQVDKILWVDSQSPLDGSVNRSVPIFAQLRG